MEERQADNKIHEYKVKMDAIDEQIYDKKKKLKNLDELEESLTQINKKITECAGIINRSVKGKQTNLKMAEISAQSKINLNKSLMNMDDERIKLQDEIYKLHDSKDTLEKDMKKEYKEVFRDPLPQDENNINKENYNLK